MATPVTLRLLSGDLLVIPPSASSIWPDLAWQALSDEDRPVHPGKIRILQGTEGDPYPTLWIDPPIRKLCTTVLGFVTDGQQAYVRAGVVLDVDGKNHESIYFFYRDDPLGPVKDILYLAKDVEYSHGHVIYEDYARGRIHSVEYTHMCYTEEDHLTIPEGVQPVPMEEFLPREWYDLLEDCQEKWRAELDDMMERTVW